MTAESEQATDVACSLNGAEFRQRRRLVREALHPHLLRSKRTASRLTLIFPDNEPLRAQLETFVSLERQCCGFLTFTISSEQEAVMLSIEGPPEAEATIEMLAGIIEGHGA